jgi:hypothetical protein
VAIPAVESGREARCGGVRVGADEHERLAGLDPVDAEARVAGRAQADQVPGNQLLEVAQDPVGAVDVAAQQVLEAVEAVEATAPLTDLDQPRPHLLRWRSDGDGSGVAQPWCCHELVTWHGPVDLGIGGAPAVVPTPEQGRYQRRRENLCATDEHVAGSGATHGLPPGPDNRQRGPPPRDDEGVGQRG